MLARHPIPYSGRRTLCDSPDAIADLTRFLQNLRQYIIL